MFLYNVSLIDTFEFKQFLQNYTAIILIVAPPLYVAPPQIREKSLMLDYFLCSSPYPEQVVNHAIRKQILNKLNVYV